MAGPALTRALALSPSYSCPPINPTFLSKNFKKESSCCFVVVVGGGVCFVLFFIDVGENPKEPCQATLKGN